MPTLLEVQRAMAAAIQAAPHALPEDWVVADGIAVATRLGIHRETYAGGAVAALRLVYPAVERLVGAAFFEAAARGFVALDPPRGSDLNGYGEGFADFLAGFPPAGGLPYLADVARLERAVDAARHAEDVAPLDLARLAAIDPADHGRLCFVSHPSVRLLDLRHNADRLWRANLDGDDAALARLDPRVPRRLLVRRGPQGIAVTAPGDAAWAVLAAIAAGRPLGDAGADVEDDVLATILAEALTDGLFVDLKLSEISGTGSPGEIAP
jgi:hypothetical protein